ncbi:hypothetical protein R69927_06641 [Paraburkholderia domus]|nr:hypothetical protein R75483_06641 [Paraburkholderia domus]CAE6870343.1 hypothetical protein R69749_06127 [Paraburkholderia domus]CAE6884325.1 hypothetical protein R70199_02722 [Paraburkholderia domus]CAE6922410.1 hypothetical protein R69927_06641 [Paraburkholderia domus]
MSGLKRPMKNGKNRGKWDQTRRKSQETANKPR